MKDDNTTLQQLKDQMAGFVKERDWNQFHTPKNLAMGIMVEAAELQEKFLWMENLASFDELKTNRQEIEDELADVVIAAFMFANACSIDVANAVTQKMKEIAAKYPVEKSKGKFTKYTKL